MDINEFKEGLRKYQVPEEVISLIPEKFLKEAAKNAEEHPRGAEAGINMFAIMLLLQHEGYDKEGVDKILKELIFNAKDYVGDDGNDNLDWLLKKIKLGID